MRHYQLIKNLSIVSFLILIPVLLLIEFKSNSVTYIIIFLQFVLIWTQVEIALRQHVLFSAQFNPFFDVKTENVLPIFDQTNRSNQESSSLKIHNVSKNPAYSIMTGRVFDDNKTIHPDNWKDRISK
ncbi:Uncharacterised protein [uncultured archaeon]|nr:Uncharacterised protein [uncultured archaeon]